MDVSSASPAALETTDDSRKGPMDAFVIRGGRPLSGRVDISGAKNA